MPVTAATIQHMRAMVIDLAAVTDLHTRELTRAYTDAWDTVVHQLTEALLDLADRPFTAAQVQRSSKVASALQAIAQQLDSLAALSGVVISDSTGHVASLAAEAQAAVAGSQLPAAGFPLVSINPDVMGTIIHRTAGQIVSRTRPLAEAGQLAVRKALTRGAAASDNPVKVARDMVRLAREGFVDLPLWRAEAISRTELNDAARLVAQSWGEANAAVVQGWEWLSSRSSTTCAACWAQDGTQHDLSDPGPYGHVNCRCTRMTITRPWSALGINLPEPEGLSRLSAQDEFRGLDKATQLKIMGPARLQALGDGAAWDSLATLKPNADWRPSWQITPVRDLLPVA